MTRKTFHEELSELEAITSQMGELVLHSINGSIEAITACNMEAADETIERDSTIDALYHEIEEHSLAIVARQAPVASDLRLCFSVIFIAIHLERMADLAVNVAKGAKRACPMEGVAPLIKLVADMGRQTADLVEASMKAFSNRDIELAHKLPDMDEPIDRMFKAYFKELAKHPDEESLEWISTIILAGRYLERIADHAVDIGERVSYLVTGYSSDAVEE
ncbi:MAG: phosphate signaling complex protein PhoU [Actinobacteria bacterium]|nr:phosphate signaling complex protein PhoU [Actinomycetota bacterium]